MINWDLIEHFEGRRFLVGYVPAPDISKSGVTIATGFDLGCRNDGDLESLGLSPALRARLTPYLGLKRHEAVRELAERPLTISLDEAIQIDRAAHKEALDRLKNLWRDETQTPFSNLPNGIQTVIASVAFQHGDLSRKCPKFWAHCTALDWHAARGELMNFGDDYPTRRKAEAFFLWGVLTNSNIM